MTKTFDLRLGSSVAFDGDRCTIIELTRDAVVLQNGTGRARLVRLLDLLRQASDAFGFAVEPAVSPLAVMSREVVESGDGWGSDCGVVPVVIVEVQPAG